MYSFHLFLTFVVNVAISESKLLSVIVMHRHGDRTPIETFPNDPHQCYWKQGLEVLTEQGQQRMRTIGNILRERYSNILPKKANLQVRSSRSERCVKSVQSLIDGLYQDDFLEAPIPIQSPPKKHDDMLYYDSLCPMYNVRVGRHMQRPENLEWVHNSLPFWKFLANKTGRNINYLNVVSETSVYNLYDLFMIQNQFNLSIPDWVDDEVLEKLYSNSVHTLKVLYNNPLLQRLRAGQFLSALRKQMAAIENNEVYKRFQIYSTHDLIVAATLMSLNVFNDQLPPFGASIVFEIHRERQYHNDVKPTPVSQNKIFVKAYYLNGTSSEDFHPLSICPSPIGCSFEEFRQITGHLISNDWNEECKADPMLLQEMMKKFSKIA